MNNSRRPQSFTSSRNPFLACLSICFALALAPESVLAAAKLKIAKASWSEKTGILTVKGSLKNSAGPVEIYDINGRRLVAIGDSRQGGAFGASISRDALAAVPCAVRVQSGDGEAIKAVKGAPKSCSGVPTCSIVSPVDGTALQMGIETHFEANATARDPAALPLKYEWDFGGGAMGFPAGTLVQSGSVGEHATFVRDHGIYRVRFVVTDALGRRCEDSIAVSVGQAPTAPPAVASLAAASVQAAPKFGSELEGKAGDVVVLPFAHSAAMGQGVVNLDAGNPWPGFFHLNAIAYTKARQPLNVDADAYELFYSAAVNPADPVGADSINSTSRNYPVGSSFSQAQIRKTDMWEAQEGWETTAGYEPFWTVDENTPTVSPLWKDPPTITKILNAAFPDMWGQGADWTWYLARNSVPDEGYLTGKFETRMTGNPGDKDNFKGGLMPGKDNPYQANTPQAFLTREADTQAFLALGIPLTDMDDQGRVNPFPVMRVEVRSKSTGQTAAAADVALNTAKDVRCSECHVYGGIGADPTVKRYLRPQKKDASGNPVFDGYGNKVLLAGEQNPRVEYFPDYMNSNPKSLEEKENEAFWNQYAIHAFMELEDRTGALLDDWDPDADGIAGEGNSHPWENGLRYIKQFKVPEPCQWCHQSAYLNECGYGTTNWDGLEYGPSEHRFHGRIQVDGQGKVIRDAQGRPLMWDDQGTGKTNPNSLFPVVDKQGNKVAMEQNCLKCHVGASQKGYHDPMYSAGIQCADCHGDMLAVGAVFAKKAQGDQPRNAKGELVDPTKLDEQGNPTPVHRVDYLDQPNCGSCHTGNGSEPVRKLAYDAADPAATPLLPENPRFAVNSAKIAFNYLDWDMNRVDKSYDLPLFRKSLDTHGKVPCAACHGSTHAIWPIKEPGANENVTALQLQGHTGTILECNVCHTADSFAKKEDLDGGQYSGDAKAGILGGPHNMHPVNDPYWWKGAQGDGANSDGTAYGGWHNDYAKLSDAKGEDQCAACHGNDHKGTRLSKTPVDRVFDFRGFDGKKLKKAGFKTRVVKVAAGTPIGCDTCHSLQTSFKGAPGH
ncbi:cytochrome C [Methylococcus capsulatus]|uniref:cytochrome C n=1 Tax=Methylococcus capsulatus TaxID=414 RepID=UPI001C52F4E2|nr:cytochrome C [Methylococcus capsulatus]QXP91410.1 cytochrome C [Methylococcus capsulatus]